jgi:hypothetical protein
LFNGKNTYLAVYLTPQGTQTSNTVTKIEKKGFLNTHLLLGDKVISLSQGETCVINLSLITF